ncbi:PorP/SprF family type IX secretion system membrane protein [Robertkochia solimangrovi]|uniref:PorP/SprF family type IX secretion system membrane protein n=1 Tax=Robertkochia solimangrovi TaxID=2213046 RepID=UPI00117F06C7|nr:type IX secretion system membrane protein PorP/SprF [Robertkochia solimangrovi]TRZ42881.1 hypothetical protein DMZ48_12500 [Robertkochia solimangrovi]
MKAMNRILITGLLLLSSYAGAQQLPQFTQYMYNTISINPAYAGSRETLSVVALYRSQWTGFEGSPRTLTASIHSPMRNDKVGLGLSFINDKLGYENFSYVYGDFSYTINTGVDSKLSFGLKGGFTQYTLDQEFLNDPSIIDDPYFNQNSNRINPNFGAGIYWHTYKWYVGLSSPRILNSDYNDGSGSDFVQSERSSYYLTGGYVFELSDAVKFKPATLLKMTNGAPPSLDLTANFLFYEKFWLGASYRWDDAMAAIADFQVTPSLRIGYAYDFATSEIRTYNKGTHEFFLLFDLNLNNSKFKSPRYF